jgi:hypothetical protein
MSGAARAGSERLDDSAAEGKEKGRNGGSQVWGCHAAWGCRRCSSGTLEVMTDFLL